MENSTAINPTNWDAIKRMADEKGLTPDQTIELMLQQSSLYEKALLSGLVASKQDLSDSEKRLSRLIEEKIHNSTALLTGYQRTLERDIIRPIRTAQEKIMLHFEALISAFKRIGAE